MRSDSELQQDARLKLLREPGVDSGRIEVRVQGGVAILSGNVRSEAESWTAADAVRHAEQSDCPRPHLPCAALFRHAPDQRQGSHEHQRRDDKCPSLGVARIVGTGEDRREDRDGGDRSDLQRRGAQRGEG